eukprot:TRINITY_DN7383_c0_g1_i1.p1 TRINITY_DN7383_c0_g1~~TRINITY_DN7383_c0_g1_i1.p1  ORF type:complete len:720 (-),score=160.27 TRINITY_DN7383_c0_g1_i1:182-2341(-)
MKNEQVQKVYLEEMRVTEDHLSYMRGFKDRRPMMWTTTLVLVVAFLSVPFNLSGVLMIMACLKLAHICFRALYPYLGDSSFERLSGGAIMSAVCGVAAIILQSHDTLIAYSIHHHSDFHKRLISRLLRTFYFIEIGTNGTSEEQKLLSQWLVKMHKHAGGMMPPNGFARDAGSPEAASGLDEKDPIQKGTKYGYDVDETRVWVLQTITWTVLQFEDLFGMESNDRTREAIVLELTCLGKRIGIPSHLLPHSYEEFQRRFESSLKSRTSTDTSNHVIEKFVALVSSFVGSTMAIRIFSLAFVVAWPMLPKEITSTYPNPTLNSRFAFVIQRIVLWTLWALYPILPHLPLRGLMLLILVLCPKEMSTISSAMKQLWRHEIPHSEMIDWFQGGKYSSFIQRVLGKWISVTSMEFPGNFARLIVSSFISWIKRRIIAIYLEMITTDMRVKKVKVPRHVSFVCDGNRRWASRNNMKIRDGHIRGAQTVTNVILWFIKYQSLGVKAITFWCFSTDNFKRSKEEVDHILGTMRDEIEALRNNPLVHIFKMKIGVLGRIEQFPEELRNSIEKLEEETKNYSDFYLQLAMPYGGQTEIVDAVKSAIVTGLTPPPSPIQGDRGTDLRHRMPVAPMSPAPEFDFKVNLSDVVKLVSEEMIGRHTYTAKIGVPPVDFIVRTSGECRTSGFMLWDSQYAEMLFLEKMWPDVSEYDYVDSIWKYSQRQIRKGQ